jgi:hypothetical protein
MKAYRLYIFFIFYLFYLYFFLGKVRTKVRWGGCSGNVGHLQGGRSGMGPKCPEQPPLRSLPRVKNNQWSFSFVNRWLWFIWEDRKHLPSKASNWQTFYLHKVPASLEAKNFTTGKAPSPHILVKLLLTLLHNPFSGLMFLSLGVWECCCDVSV